LLVSPVVGLASVEAPSLTAVAAGTSEVGERVELVEGHVVAEVARGVTLEWAVIKARSTGLEAEMASRATVERSEPFDLDLMGPEAAFREGSGGLGIVCSAEQLQIPTLITSPGCAATVDLCGHQRRDEHHTDRGVEYEAEPRHPLPHGNTSDHDGPRNQPMMVNVTRADVPNPAKTSSTRWNG
jgi:hypothetical protein